MSFWSLLLFLVVPWPVGTDRRLRRTPWVTWTLIALNVALYAASVVLGRAAAPTGNSLLGDFVSGLPDNALVFSRFGLMPVHPYYHALFTYMFLHVSFGHLFWNMVFLWLFGPHVEDALGRGTFLVLYFGGGVAAGLLHMAITLLLVARNVVPGAAPLIGASGAISSVLAPFALRFHRANIRLFWLPGLLLPGGWARLELPALWGLGIWLLQNLGGAFKSVIAPESGGTAYWAHVGGFVFGLVAAQLTDLLRDGRLDYLLQDARAAMGRGQDLLSGAITNYRAFLQQDPDNAAVRAELARALALRHGQENNDRDEAALEMLAAVRLSAQQGRTLDAAGLAADARALGLPLLLTPRERLRLSAAAEERADADTAVWLLQALIAQTPEAPEDEMARLRLGQLLMPAEPADARSVLSGFLDRYPDSAWTPRVRDLLRQTYV